MGVSFRRRRGLSTARPSQTLVASGERVTAKRARDLARINSAWQQRAFAYYDELGEIKYAASFFARLSRLELYAGEWADGETGRELIPTQDEQAVSALARVKDPGGSGGRSTMLGTWGRLRFLAGECYLFFTERDGEERWEILSTSELRPNPSGSGYQRVRAPSLTAEEYKEPGEDEWDDVNANEAMAYRLWRSHPQYSQWPDSPMRGVLELCEQLLMLDRSVRSRSLSRLAGNGALFIDDRISPAPDTPKPDEDPEADPFIDDLTATMVEPMSDDGAAEHVVPLVVRVPVPVSDGVKLSDMIYHLRLTEPGELYPETGLRDEVLRRIAIGLEMPAEILLGMADANHWSAWVISDDAWEHLEPYCQELVDDLTASYFLPTLRKAGVENWQNYAIGYDAGRLRTEPEQSKDAKDLHDRGAIGDAALRRVTGFEDTDAPNEFEMRRHLSISSRDPGFALGADPKGTGDNPIERENETPGGPPPDDNETTDRPGSRSETDPAPPNPDDSTVPGLSSAANTRDAVRVARVLAAVQIGIARAREVASNRVKSKAKSNPDLRDQVAELNGGYAPAAVGPEGCRALGLSERGLIEGARALIAAPLKGWGLNDQQAKLILAALEEHAALTIYEPALLTLPQALRNYVSHVVTGQAPDA